MIAKALVIMAVAVGAIGYAGTTQDAQAAAATTFKVVGTTAGVMLGTAPALFKGFKDGKDSTVKPAAPQRPGNVAG